MALPSSGAISLSAIASEFGDSTPNSISEFYRGGSLVPNATVNNSVPTSGAISFNDFYGASDQLWTTTITVGVNEIRFGDTLIGIFYGYSDDSAWAPGASQGNMGSASDSTVDFYSGATLAALTVFVSSGNSATFAVTGAHSNSGWSTMTMGSTALNRTDASFSQGNGVTTWSWTLSGNTNPMGTSGTTTVTFV